MFLLCSTNWEKHFRHLRLLQYVSGFILDNFVYIETLELPVMMFRHCQRWPYSFEFFISWLFPQHLSKFLHHFNDENFYTPLSLITRSFLVMLYIFLTYIYGLTFSLFVLCITLFNEVSNLCFSTLSCSKPFCSSPSSAQCLVAFTKLISRIKWSETRK